MNIEVYLWFTMTSDHMVGVVVKVDMYVNACRIRSCNIRNVTGSNIDNIYTLIYIIYNICINIFKCFLIFGSGHYSDN